ncbi:BOLA class I histocompatibility antigen, alpha chain BL3-6-like [Leptodactylus fuscus]|uniref:BOLA class I histocompatibility antigen, alpha chain BL3-6-like n=1 Tax=Leptodactylus fuscus TaxID=238119 RepID=UPI003F4E52D4
MSDCALPRVLLLLLSAPCVLSGGHSHYFYTTLTYNLPFDFPPYYTARTLDDIPLFWYDSDNGVVERRVSWFKGANSSLWDDSVTESKFHNEMRQILNNIMYYLNVTEGSHVLQTIEGCVVYENGSVENLLSYHYNGEPLMFLDWENRQWTASLPKYEDLVYDLYGNTNMSEDEKDVIVNECSPHIQELLTLGNCTLGRKEAPVVIMKLIPTDSGGVRLYCRAYGHYPKDISIMWYKNGQPISEEAMERLTLPLLDMTYLTSLSLIVTSADYDVYTCKVNHESMSERFTQDFRIFDHSESLSSSPSHVSIGAVIAICLAAVLVSVLVVFGSLVFVKSRRQ